MTRSDATDHRHRPLDRSWSPTRWPLPPLTAATAALTTSAVILALAAPTGSGTTAQGTPIADGRLAPSQAQRAAAQATADRFTATFSRSLSGPITARELQAAGAASDLADRIANATPRGAAPNLHAPPARGSARVEGVVVRADRRGWLATATVLVADPTTPAASREAARLSLTFRLEHQRGRLIVVDANAGGHG
ncbi:hypothetical protein SK069_17340 [Patulibacter brassicae]|uniref:Conjugal transfer protein n=1 Tax=Patulibacter brassicae TaxID=1705717 RepID=A0ABU4VND7_9ACTN|nr:hypothetical protein [Patulibacter brassicae]MDX8153366.1 hypothetical protein [Patulibacter brassicae]